MSWSVKFLPEARKDLKNLAGNQSRIVSKALDRVSKNPLPRNEGGYGIPLGNKGNCDLTGCNEIKLRGEGLRAIYKLFRTESEMLVIIISVRESEEVYDKASERIIRHGI